MIFELETAFRIILLIGLIICAIATAVSKRIMTALIIFTSYSVLMSLIWLLLRAPDLAVTEAAVGAGVNGVLFFITLRKIHLIDKDHEKAAASAKTQEADTDEK